MRVLYSTHFIRSLKKCSEELQEMTIAKVELFKDPLNHNCLGVHKLNGRLKDRYAFWVTKKIRITFEYVTKNDIALLAIGGHDDVYK